MTKLTEVAAAVIERAGEFLLAQRPEGKPYPGYWEFPGGKIEPGETPTVQVEATATTAPAVTTEQPEPTLPDEFIMFSTGRNLDDPSKQR